MANQVLGKAASAVLLEDDKKTSGTQGTANDKVMSALGQAAANAGSLAAQQIGPVSSPNRQNYKIDYNDQRFKDVEAEKQAALDQANAQYDKMIGATDELYQGLIDATNEYGEKQAQLQQEQTEFAIEQINQQKEQAEKDYTKEQQGAYADWMKQSDQYGAEAERMAAQGLQGTGYSESSQVRMYTAYQNRLAVARDTFNRAELNYNNAIKEAILNNNSMQAEIAFKTLETTLTLGIENFEHNNELMLQKMDTQREIDNTYHSRWQDVLAQMNEENALAENIRQYNESMEMERQQMQIAQEQWNAEYDLKQREYEESIRQFEAELARLKKNDSKANQLAIKELELKKQQLQQEQKQWEAQMKEEKRQFNKSYELQKKNLNKSSGSSGSSKSSGSSGSAKISKSSSNGSSGSGSVSGPTAAQKKSYTTFQTNIANMMMKNPGESTINNMAKSIEEAYESGKLTKSQAKELLGQLD